MKRPRLISRIAIFSALIYVLSYGTSFLPNVNFIFFIVFSAGFLWGAVPGILVGLIGMWLWTSLNPYGPALVPVALAQILGAAASGVVGALFRKGGWQQQGTKTLALSLVLAACACTILFYLPVSAIDAWLFQPFWPRFYGGLLWGTVSLAFNVVVFPLLFKATRHLYSRECGLR